MTSRSTPTALIFGATGKIGGAFVHELYTNPGVENVQVIAAVRKLEQVEQFKTQGIEARLVDLDKPERYGLDAIQSAFDGIDRVFLLTSYSVSMLAQSKAAVDAAKKAGVSHIVHMGAYSTDDTTVVHLGWHQFVERYIEWSGLGYIHLRPNVFMQNIPKFSLKENGIIHQYFGDAPVSWIDTDDIAAAAATVLREPQKHHGKTYPLAVEALTIYQVADVLTKVVGKPFRYEPQSPDEWLNSTLKGGMEPTYAHCVHNVFIRTANRTLTDAADVFDNFETLTGKQPTKWKDFAAKHRTMFEY